MTFAIADRRRTAFLFAGLVVVAACAMVMRSAAFARNPEVGSFGVTFDLCITIPAVYYLLLVRPRHASPLTMVPLFIVCLTMARAVVPAAHRGFLRDLDLMLIPIELGVVVVIGWRIRAGMRRSREASDPIARIETIVGEAFGESRVARIVASEIAALYLGLFGWSLPDPQPDGIASTTFHRKTGWGSIVICALVVIASEGIAAHLFIQQWSHKAAWLFTALDVWGAIWFLGDYHALRLRPTVVRDASVDFRLGFRWAADIPTSGIASVESIQPLEAERLRGTKGYLRFALLDDPTHLVRFTAPVRFQGAFGLQRDVTALGLRPDEAGAIDAIRALIASDEQRP